MYIFLLFLLLAPLTKHVVISAPQMEFLCFLWAQLHWVLQPIKIILPNIFLQWKNCLFPTCHFTADRSTCFPAQTGPAWGYSTQLTPRVASSIFPALYHKYRRACYWKRSPISCAATYTQVDIFNAGRHKNCFIATYVDDKLYIAVVSVSLEWSHATSLIFT